MAIEELFKGNYIVLYLVSIIILLIGEKKINLKIIILFLLTYLIKIYDILDVKTLFPLLLVGLFIYFEFLEEDKVKQLGMRNIFYKIVDYLYQIIFIYHIIAYAISLSLVSHIFVDNVSYSFLLYLISICILVWTLTQVYSNRYGIYKFEEIYNKIIIILSSKEDNKLNNAYKMIINFEDKSYFYRKNNYNILCIDFLKYRYKISKFSLKFNREKICHCFRLFVIDLKNFFRTKIRGYSTIEMQVIRTLGLQSGSYKYTFRRKIYEFLYSQIFFKSMKKYLIESNLRVDSFKEDILYVYLNIAPIYFNNKKYKNISSMWNKTKINDCSIEEIYIGVLCLSNKLRNINNLYKYKNVIKNYNIDINKLNKKIKLLIN